MVESLKELNQLCQKPDYKKTGNWYVRTILRDVALPATWLLLHTSITANQVTLVSLAISFLGMCFFAIPGPGPFLTGVLLLQLWYYLDHVDGQIARYRKTASLTGRFLDFLTHHAVHVALFFTLGFYCYAVTASSFFIVWCFLSALAILTFNVMHDVKYKTFFERIEILRLSREIVLKQRGNCPLKTPITRTGSVKRIFSILHKLCEIHVMMNILTLAALIQMFLSALDLRFILFILYGLLAPIIAVVKLVYILTNKQIDKEFNEIFDASA